MKTLTCYVNFAGPIRGSDGQGRRGTAGSCKFFTDSRTFPTKDVMGLQKFNVTLKFLENQGFSVPSFVC